MDQNQESSGWILKSGMWACGIFAAVCLVFGGFEWIVGRLALGNSQNLNDLGNYGSFLQGAVASPWALAGVFLLVMAFLGSQQQLALQREQLAAQEKQLNDQLTTMKKQSFEDSFFQLLNLHRELQSQFETDTVVPDGGGIRTVRKTVHGKECFRVFRDDMNTQYRTNKASARLMLTEFPNEAPALPSETEQALIAYTQVYHAQQQQLAHYFRNLYHIIKFVKTSDMSDKRRYTSLVRAQLSAYELPVLFYNCLTPYGERFRPLVEEFGLLEHLDPQLLLNPSHARDETLYAKSTYQ
jgi:hypothetical protein